MIIQKKAAEEVVPLENILSVTSVDSATAEPYQFKIFIEGRKAAPEVWTLKARTEVSQVLTIVQHNSYFIVFQEARLSWITALQPGSAGRLSHDGDDSAYEQVHVWTKPQHAASHTPPPNEYRALEARDEPSLYFNVQSEEPKPTYAVPTIKLPVVPDIPVVIECGDLEPVSTAPHPSPTFVGKTARNGKGDSAVGQTSSLGVSQPADAGGFKTPSRVPKEYQELNFQQIQFLIAKLEALKTGSPSKAPAEPSNEEEHLYDQIPEIERPTKKHSTERGPKPKLPLRPPKPKHEHTGATKLGLKDDQREFPPRKSQNAAAKADSKPAKPLG